MGEKEKTRKDDKTPPRYKQAAEIFFFERQQQANRDHTVLIDPILDV